MEVGLTYAPNVPTGRQRYTKHRMHSAVVLPLGPWAHSVTFRPTKPLVSHSASAPQISAPPPCPDPVPAPSLSHPLHSFQATHSVNLVLIERPRRDIPLHTHPILITSNLDTPVHAQPHTPQKRPAQHIPLRFGLIPPAKRREARAVVWREVANDHDGGGEGEVRLTHLDRDGEEVGERGLSVWWC